MAMTQLILNSREDPVILPEASRERYSAAPVPLSEEVEMISGRLVRELRGSVWNISYQYGYFNESMKDLAGGL